MASDEDDDDECGEEDDDECDSETRGTGVAGGGAVRDSSNEAKQEAHGDTLRSLLEGTDLAK